MILRKRWDYIGVEDGTTRIGGMFNCSLAYLLPVMDAYKLEKNTDLPLQPHLMDEVGRHPSTPIAGTF